MEESTQKGLASRLTAIAVIVGLVGVLMTPGACRRSANPSAATGNSTSRSAAVAAASEIRIVSLSPAISRTLVDFSLNNRIVGRTPHCECLKKEIPVVGDLVHIDYEQLIRVKPTHVLVQPPAAGADAQLLELAKMHGWVVGQWRLNDRDDIEALVRELPGTLFGEGSSELPGAMQRSAELLNDIAIALSPGAEPSFRGRTLMVNAVDPVMAFGARTYLDDVLRSLGGTNVVTDAGWVQLSLEDVVRLDPQAIILVKQGELLSGAVPEQAGPLWEIDVEATRERRIAILNHPDALMPSSGVVGVAKELRKTLKSFETNSQ